MRIFITNTYIHTHAHIPPTANTHTHTYTHARARIHHLHLISNIASAGISMNLILHFEVSNFRRKYFSTYFQYNPFYMRPILSNYPYFFDGSHKEC